MGQTTGGYFDGVGAGTCPPTAAGISPGAPVTGRAPFHTAGAPVNGAAGSFFGVAPKYSVLIRDDTLVHHYNTGTQASPTWTIITGTP